MINRACILPLLCCVVAFMQPLGAPAADSVGPLAPAVSERSALPGVVVDVRAGEFFLQAPDTIRAGLTTFRYRQTGLVAQRVKAKTAMGRDSLTEANGDDTYGFHMLWLIKLDSGRTTVDYFTAKTSDAPTPWAHLLGGPGFSIPPATSNATFVLEPGNYILVCPVGGAREEKSRSHLRHGMMHALTVNPSAKVARPLPAPDVIARITGEGAVDFSVPITRGRHVIRVDNMTPTNKEFKFNRLWPGHAVAEVYSWKRRSGTPRPWNVWGGLSSVPPNGSVTTTMDFEAATYVVGTAPGRAPETSLGFTVSRKR